MNMYRNFDEEVMMDCDHYWKHVHAMTRESLHSKTDIAAELAFRDIKIEALQAENARLVQEREALAAKVDAMIVRIYENHHGDMSEAGRGIIMIANKSPVELLDKRDMLSRSQGYRESFMEVKDLLIHVYKIYPCIELDAFIREMETRCKTKQAEELNNGS